VRIRGQAAPWCARGRQRCITSVTAPSFTVIVCSSTTAPLEGSVNTTVWAPAAIACRSTGSAPTLFPSTVAFL